MRGARRSSAISAAASAASAEWRRSSLGWLKTPLMVHSHRYRGLAAAEGLAHDDLLDQGAQAAARVADLLAQVVHPGLVVRLRRPELASDAEGHELARHARHEPRVA